jgi:hypothetical protein
LGIILPILLYLSFFSKLRKLTLLDVIFKSMILIISSVIFGFSTVFSFRNLIKGTQ